jgi:hypothetical protein
METLNRTLSRGDLVRGTQTAGGLENAGSLL